MKVNAALLSSLLILPGCLTEYKPPAPRAPAESLAEASAVPCESAFVLLNESAALLAEETAYEPVTGNMHKSPPMGWVVLGRPDEAASRLVYIQAELEANSPGAGTSCRLGVLAASMGHEWPVSREVIGTAVAEAGMPGLQPLTRSEGEAILAILLNPRGGQASGPEGPTREEIPVDTRAGENEPAESTPPAEEEPADSPADSEESEFPDEGNSVPVRIDESE